MMLSKRSLRALLSLLLIVSLLAILPLASASADAQAGTTADSDWAQLQAQIDAAENGGTISGNTAGDKGGGVYACDDIYITKNCTLINNCTLSFNTAPDDGGIYMGAISLAANGVTFIGNKASTGAGIGCGSLNTENLSGTVTVNGGTVSADSRWTVGISAASVSLGWRRSADSITAALCEGSVTIQTVLVSFVSECFIPGSEAYYIHTADDWNAFCDCLEDHDNYSGFAGKTVYLEADISVTRMAGSGIDDYFSGTFDGQGHTLHVTLTGAGDYCAPFCYLKNEKTFTKS